MRTASKSPKESRSRWCNNEASRFYLILPPAPENPEIARELAKNVSDDNVAGKRWATVVEKAWTDAAFKERLLSDARSAVKELGMDVAPQLDIRVVEDTASRKHLVLPAPASDELSEEDLAAVAGGGSSPFQDMWNYSVKHCGDIADKAKYYSEMVSWLGDVDDIVKDNVKGRLSKLDPTKW